MKKITLLATALFGVMFVSFSSACINVDYSKIKEGDPVPNNVCPQAVGVKVYPTKEAFIKGEGETCGTATDGVNTFFGKDFMASTRIGYPENFVAEWSCLEKKAMVYSTKEEFEKAEGQTCKLATDGCNTFGFQNGKIAFGTDRYCEDIYGDKGQAKWSCLDNEKKPLVVGGDVDEHGCKPSAGYTWSEEKKECVRPWEEMKTYSTKEEFEKAEGQTCKSATDGCNTFFVKDGKIGGGTMMYCEDIYGENGQEKWSCIDNEKISDYAQLEVTKVIQGKDGKSLELKNNFGNKYIATISIVNLGDKYIDLNVGDKVKIAGDYIESNPTQIVNITDLEKVETSKLSENDANHLKQLKKDVSKDFQAAIEKMIDKYKQNIKNFTNTKKVKLTNTIVSRLDKIIFDLLDQYPQDIALPETASNKYLLLEYIRLSFMNLDFDAKSSSAIKNNKNVINCNDKDNLEQCKKE